MNEFHRLRKENHLKQREMAKILNVSLSHYTKLEGNFVKPSVDVLERVKANFADEDMNNFFKKEKA